MIMKQNLKNHRAGLHWTLLVLSSPQVQLLLQVERINLQRSLVLQICQDNFMVPAMKLMCRLTTDLRRMKKLQVLYLKGSTLRSIWHLMRTGVTHKQSRPSAGGRVPSVLNTFDAERKQLVAVGLLTEHGYARSIARFAANIGPFSWTISVKRIEKSLAPGVKFGPGWVGENDIPPHKPLFSSPLPSQLPPPPSLPLQKPFPALQSSTAIATACSVRSKQEKLSTKPEKDIFPGKHLPSTRLSDVHLSPVPRFASMTTSVSAVNKSEPFTERAESVSKLNSLSGFNVLNSSEGVINQRAPFQLHQNSAIHPGLIGFNATCGFNHATQMGKLLGVARPAGLGIQSSQMADKV